MKKVFILSLLLLLTTTSVGRIVFAHSYHYEVQISNELNLNKGKLNALNMTWLYDEDVSGVMLQDQKDLKKLAAKLIKDLDLLGYFTQMKLNGEILALGKAKNVHLQESENTLMLFFTLPFKKPISIPKGSTLSLNHEDPSAIAILYYEKPSEIVINGTLKKRCKTTVKEKGDFDEGEFPQIVKIYC